jgi:hypothetical protein
MKRSALLLTLVVLVPLSIQGSEQPGLVVHEWGTFTSIAGPDGRAVDWQPLRASDDLPCFVEHLGVDLKGTLAAKVRMETPVLYFYAPRRLDVDVTVQFNRGLVTEWFPRAAVTPSTVNATAAAGFKRPGFSSSVSWHGVSVAPGATAPFPDDRRGGHYYLARRTDATPLTVGAVSEKFLFYRGVGAFDAPISASVTGDGSLAVSSPSGAPLGDVMLFENRGGRVAYHLLTSSSTRATLDPLRFDGESAAPSAELEAVLIANGLYPAEAKAMVDTWRDSWFEEGSRLFYITPRKTIDDLLPLDINPAPASVARVFVGRVELVTATTREAVAAALASNDQRTLAAYGRFLPAIVGSLPDAVTSDERSRRARAVQIAQSGSTPPRLCP